MGQNSTEVAYGFGQMGSVFTNLAKPVFPPEDHVIVAIQFVADNALTALDTETLDTMGPQFLTIEDDEMESAGGPDANFLGAATAACLSATTTVITIADSANNARIKKGQYVLIGADADTIDTGFTVDTAAGHVMPIYNGPNAQGVKVVSLTGGTFGTTLTVEGVGSTAVDVSGIDGSNTLYFIDGYHGAGGTTIEGVTFPKGLTIYGRWASVTPTADADGGIICYFGK